MKFIIFTLFSLFLNSACSLKDAKQLGKSDRRNTDLKITEEKSQMTETDNPPPLASLHPKEFMAFGDKREDPYFWLRDVQNPEVIEYLKLENEHTAAAMKRTESLQKTLYGEMKSRIKETDTSAPARRAPYFYYTRTEAEKPYRIHCRKKAETNVETNALAESQNLNDTINEEILLDENKLSEGHRSFALGGFKVSPDQKLLAYSVDFTGAEKYSMSFKNLETKLELKDHIPDLSSGMEWGADNKTIYYLTRDKMERPYRVYRHILGQTVKDDQLLYEEKDEAFHLHIVKTLDQRFILVYAGSSTSTEVRYLNSEKTKDLFKVFSPRRKDIRYSIDHSGEYFYVRTNESAKNFKVMRVPENNLAAEQWREFIPHREAVVLNDISAFKNWLIISKRENGLPKFTIIDLRTMGSHDIDFPEPAYDADEGQNLEFDTAFFRLQYSSLVSPPTTYDYDMENRRLISRKTEEVLGGYDSANYVTERLWAKASDGIMIPVSIVYKKGLQKNGSRPCYLDGYGAYGLNNDVYFSSSRLSLLDRGFIYAVAHIRGGGEMGEAWHDGGKMKKKKNTFTDFISVAEFLMAEKYTSSEKLVISGGSAGGLLMGAVLNLRPELFRAAILSVPFVDLMGTMSDATLPLTVVEYEEWGNPNLADDYQYMRTYSPYDNLAAKAYPAILVLTSLNDTRVGYWEAAKWVARLRSLKTDKNPLLLKVDMEAGHAGAKDRYKYLEEIALKYSFVLSLP